MLALELAIKAVGALLPFQTIDQQKGRSRANQEVSPAHDSRAQGCASVSGFCLRRAARRGWRTGLDGRADWNRQRCAGRCDPVQPFASARQQSSESQTVISPTFGQPVSFVDPRLALLGVRLHLGR